MNVALKNNLFTLVGYNAVPLLAGVAVALPFAVAKILPSELVNSLTGELGVEHFTVPFIIAWITLLSAGYIVWGYLTLEPRPKRNFWSVSFIPLTSLPFILTALVISVEILRCFFILFIVPLYISMAANMIILQSTALYGTSEGEILAIVLATYLPALCMYLGVCLKTWRRRTSSNGQTLPEEEVSEVMQYD